MTYKNCVTTQIAALSSFCFFSAGILSFFNNSLQNTMLMNIPHFGIKIDLKLLKTCKKNGLKIDEFYTHHVSFYIFSTVAFSFSTSTFNSVSFSEALFFSFCSRFWEWCNVLPS